MARKDSNPLKVALQMREAVAYLAALASRSELDKIAHELLRVHWKLGTQIDLWLVEKNRDEAEISEEKRNLPLQKTIHH